MEKNKQDLKEDIFLREYLKEIKLEVPKSNFTDNIMDVLLKDNPKLKITDMPLTAVVGAHAGPKTIGLGYLINK